MSMGTRQAWQAPPGGVHGRRGRPPSASPSPSQCRHRAIGDVDDLPNPVCGSCGTSPGVAPRRRGSLGRPLRGGVPPTLSTARMSSRPEVPAATSAFVLPLAVGGSSVLAPSLAVRDASPYVALSDVDAYRPEVLLRKRPVGCSEDILGHILPLAPSLPMPPSIMAFASVDPSNFVTLH